MSPLNLFGKKAGNAADAVSADEMKNRLLALNRGSAPFQIVNGAAEEADLIAEWKIVDARWHEIFAKASLTKVFRIFLKLDAERHEVRAKDKEYTVEWRAGIPGLAASVSTFQGQQSAIEFGSAYAFTEKNEFGQVYNYRFNTGEMKKPIQTAAQEAGWKYKGVAFGKF